MIDFIYRLNSIALHFPMSGKLTLSQLSEATGVSVPHTIQHLCDGLNKDIDISYVISHEDLQLLSKSLNQKYKFEIEEQEKFIEKQKSHALAVYDRVQEKVSILEHEHKYHNAFLSLSYFVGDYSESMETSTLVSICNDILRIGLKSKANIQEMGRWFQKAIACDMSLRSKEGMDDALDLIETYGEYFLNEDSGKGPMILGSVLVALEESAARYGVWEFYKSLIGRLYPET